MPNILDMLGGSSTDWSSYFGGAESSANRGDSISTGSTSLGSFNGAPLGVVKNQDLLGLDKVKQMSLTSSGAKPSTDGFGSLSSITSLGTGLISGIGTMLNAGQISSKSQRSEAIADGAVDTIGNVASAFGPVGTLAGTALKLVNGIGGSLMNHNSTAKAADAFKINDQIKTTSGYGGVLSNAQDAQGDGQGYKKAGLFGKLFTNTTDLKQQFNNSALQQNATAGVLSTNKSAIQGGLASQDMYAGRNQNDLYGGNQWNSGAITYGKEGTSIHIKKSHEGKFTAYKERSGKSTSEALNSTDPHVRKMAQFAANAKKWKHQMGGKVGIPRPGAEIPHGGAGPSIATRPTMMQPVEEKQVVENKGDLAINAQQQTAVSTDSKDAMGGLPMSNVAPFPIGADIMSMVSQALAPPVDASTPVDPSSLPTMQDGGQLFAGNSMSTDENPPANIPLSTPATHNVANPSAMVGSLANNSYRKLTPGEMQFWNGYVDYVDKKGYKGNPDLDVRDKGLSSNLYNEYAKQQNFNIPYDHFVPVVQANIKQSRQALIDQARKGQAVIPGMIDKFGQGHNLDVGDEVLNQKFMNGLSQIDGWAGSKTTSYKFPMASPAKVYGTVPGETLQDQKKYKQGVDFTKWGDGANGGTAPTSTTPPIHYKDGGAINVIVDGSLHAHKHNMEDLPLLDGENITSKGIPVVVIDAEGGVIQQAEVERDELILHYELTKQLEALMKEGTDESAIEAGRLLAKEIVKNTKDSKSKILKIA